MITPREVIAAANRLPDSVVDEVCGPGGLSGATEAQHRELVRRAQPRVIAWGREESDVCEANTPGCSIDHGIESDWGRVQGSCEPW